MVFPASLPSFTNPTGTDELADAIGGLTHAQMHAAENDAIEEIAAALGAGSLTIDSSWNPTLGSTGTVPTIGAGSKSGWYATFGPFIIMSFRVVFGSGATAGTGIYTITPPVTIATGNAAEGTGQAVSSGGVPSAVEWNCYNNSIAGIVTTTANAYVGASVPTGMGTNGSNFQGQLIGRLV